MVGILRFTYEWILSSTIRYLNAYILKIINFFQHFAIRIFVLKLSQQSILKRCYRILSDTLYI